MKNYINFENVNCKDCYKCLRNCPVKSIRFSNHQAEIIEDECILCGNCYLTCPQKAKEIRNDIQTIKALLKSNKEIYVSIAPSFIANYKIDNKSINLDTMRKALKKLGFKDVEETAVGAQEVTHEYERIIENREMDVIVSTCCPSVNLLIRKYYPDAVKYMAPVTTPMVAHAKKLKEEHKNCCVVFIGPCLAKKEEVDENLSVIDCAITFSELTKWFIEENITLEATEASDEQKYKSRLYPISSGIIKTMKKDPEYNYIAIDGLDKCKEVLSEILTGSLKKCFIEMSSCQNSCVGGPGMDTKNSSIEKVVSVLNFSGDDFYKDSELELRKEYTPSSVKKDAVPEYIIKMLLQKIGKTKPDDELNCGSCGYNTCEEKATAMYYGKTEPSMCLPYLKNKAISYMDDLIANTPNGIIILNDNLEVEMMNKSACKIINISNPDDVKNQPIVRMIDPTIYLKVLNTKKNIYNDVSYLAEYKKYVEQNVIYDEEFKVVMVIARDITDDIKAKKNKETISSKTIEITDKVIQKQMRAVQEIASLLGETTAETKVALEKLKESLND